MGMLGFGFVVSVVIGKGEPIRVPTWHWRVTERLALEFSAPKGEAPMGRKRRGRRGRVQGVIGLEDSFHGGEERKRGLTFLCFPVSSQRVIEFPGLLVHSWVVVSSISLCHLY